MDTDTSVPFGTGMASISLPSVPLIGTPRGNTISRPVLQSSEKRVRENIQGWLLTLYGVMLLEGSWRPKTFNLNVRIRKLITYSRSVSRQTASRYGRETSLSWLRSSPLFSCFASRISCRSFACTSLWRARRWKMRDRAPDVVSVAAKVKELQKQVITFKLSANLFIYLTHVTWPRSSSSESLSSSEAFMFSLTEYRCLMSGM